MSMKKIPAIITGVLILSIVCALFIAGTLNFPFHRNGGSFSEETNNLLENGKIFEETIESSATTVVNNENLGQSQHINKESLWGNGDQFQTLATLRKADIPENDVYEIAARLDGVKEEPILPNSNKPKIYLLGDEHKFWVLNIDDDTYQLVNAKLKYKSEHLYFWVQEGISYKPEDLKNLADAFEMKIYPTDREFFGSEWTPGIDNDPHIFILYTNGMGGAAGYFSSSDTVPKEIDKYSNCAEMFYLSAEHTLDQDFTYGVLAHEFQHMIHWNQDRNETSWINEGFSELATLLNGYSVGGFDYSYAIDPDLQLNDWPSEEQGEATMHYGASFLFMTYYLHRFGEDLTKSLVSNPMNGMDSIDTVLMKAHIVDPKTANSINANDIFQDWTIANYVQNDSVGNGNYDYSELWQIPTFRPTETLNCPTDWRSRQVKQYGVDYIRLSCSQSALLKFRGAEITRVLPIDAYSGKFFFWSNRGNESDMKLTRTFDFTEVDTPLHLVYKVWFDIEEDYDYLYLLASEDGKNWQILEPPSCTEENPTGANHGCGYNGKSNEWITETIDLSQFTGKKVTLQFEYITDAVVNGDGFMLDDVTIPETGYFADFENDDGGWIARGFVRITNQLPQFYRLALLIIGKKSVWVKKLDLSNQYEKEIVIPAVRPDKEVILVISGTTRYTRIPADYFVSFAYN